MWVKLASAMQVISYRFLQKAALFRPSGQGTHLAQDFGHSVPFARRKHVSINGKRLSHPLATTSGQWPEGLKTSTTSALSVRHARHAQIELAGWGHCTFPNGGLGT